MLEVHGSWRKRLRRTLSHTPLEVYCNQVKICIEIALDCLNKEREKRPNIQDIVSRLNKTEIIIGDQGVHNEQVPSLAIHLYLSAFKLYCLYLEKMNFFSWLNLTKKLF
jgi:hypothetical protein